MTRQIFAAEINFEDTPLHVRDKFNDSERNIKRILAALRSRVDEVFILANRYRFTVYAVNHTLTPLTEYFQIEHSLKGYVQFYYNSGESVTHLMATASGLLSPVKGEARILDEIIKCFQWASACGCLGITLDNTLTKAIETGKTVRTETGIDKFCSSVVETGLDLIYNQLENLHQKNFLIVGTGKMARLALEYLTKEGIRNIAVTGQDFSKCRHLARKFAVSAFPLESFSDFFFNADVIIGVSNDELKLNLTNPEDKPALTEEECKTKFILDLGIPLIFDPALEKYATEFYNLDDLRRMQPSPLESFGGLEVAWRMVMKASGDFVHLLQLLDQSPVLSAYLTRQFSLKNGELKVKPKRTLRNMLLFKKTDSVLGLSGVNDYSNAKAHVNNHQAENGREVIRNVTSMGKFKFLLSEN